MIRLIRVLVSFSGRNYAQTLATTAHSPKLLLKSQSNKLKAMAPRNWTAEQRQQQAERIRQTKPWESSTGPRTDTGKQRSSQNALKHGRRAKGYRSPLQVAIAHAWAVLAEFGEES